MQTNYKKRAFTMIELIFVVVILGILASIAVPKLRMVTMEARVTKANLTMETITKDVLNNLAMNGGELKTANGDIVVDLSDITDGGKARANERVIMLSESQDTGADSACASMKLQNGKLCVVWNMHPSAQYSNACKRLATMPNSFFYQRLAETERPKIASALQGIDLAPRFSSAEPAMAADEKNISVEFELVDSLFASDERVKASKRPASYYYEPSENLWHFDAKGDMCN